MSEYDGVPPEPCPYCGEKKKLISRRFCEDIHKPDFHGVQCLKCGACGPLARTYDKGREKWNRRVYEQEAEND